MIRELVGVELVPPEKHFRWRGGEISRLEGFTDAVFAFAVTLLVVSLEVPRTFDELTLAMKGFVAFAVCFAILVHIWYYHYIYSRRYGLQTVYTILLNSALIFVVLFYVYPLKFLFTLAVGGLSGGATMPVERLAGMIRPTQVPALILIYSLGYAAVFALLALLYQDAYRKRSQLALNEFETLKTRQAVFSNAGYACVGILVAIVSQIVPARISGFSAFLFFLNAVVGTTVASIFGKQARLALGRIQESSRAAGS